MNRYTFILLPGLLSCISLFISCAGQNHLKAGDSYMEQRNWERALVEYKMAYSESNDASIQSKINLATENAVKDHMRNGQDFLEKEEYQRAVSEFSEVLQLQPNHELARQLLEEARQGKKKKEYIQIVSGAKKLFTERKLGEAKQELLRAIDLYEKNNDAQAGLIQINKRIAESDDLAGQAQNELAKKNWKQALDIFQQAISIWVDNPAALAGQDTANSWITYDDQIARARISWDQSKKEEAFDLFESAQKIHATVEVKELIQRLGEECYPPAIDKADSLFDNAARTTDDIGKRMDLLEACCQAYDKARRYKQTSHAIQRLDKIKSELSSVARRIGLQCMSLMDFESAVKFLEVAQRNGESVNQQVGESKQQLLFWQGLSSESQGQPRSASDFYRKALNVSSSPMIIAALERVEKKTASPTPLQLAIIKESRSNYDVAMSDIQQRIMLSSFRNSRITDETIIVEGASFPQLGTGIDAIRGTTRNTIVKGEAESRDVSTEEWSISEHSVIFSQAKGNQIDYDLGLNIPKIMSGGKIGYGSVAKSAYFSQEYNLDIKYELITRVETLNNPAIDLKNDVKADEWIEAFGTHFVSEVCYGGTVVLTLSRKCQSAEEREDVSNRFGIFVGIINAGTSQSQQFEQAIKEQNFNMSVKMRGGSKGSTPIIQSFEDFKRFVQDFKSALSKENQTAIRIKTRYYGDPGVSGFPLNKQTFAVCLQRNGALQAANYLLTIILAKGENDLAIKRAIERRERAEAERAALEKRTKGLKAIKDAFSKSGSVWQSKWIQIDVSSPSLPDTFNLSGLDIKTDSSIQIVLVKANAYYDLQRQGVSVAEDTKYNPQIWTFFSPYAIFYLDTSRQDAGSKIINRRLPRGEYYYFIYNNNALLAAPVTIRCDVSE